MVERRNSTTEVLLAAAAAAAIALVAAAWKNTSADSIPALELRFALHPDDDALRRQLVQKLLDADRAPEAISLLRHRLEQNPQDDAARNSLADLLADNGKSNEAVALLRRQLDQHSDDAATREKLADLLLTAGQGDQAAALYKQVLVQSPGSVTAAYGLARAYMLQHDNLSAQRTLEESLKRHPDDPPSNALLADLAIQSLGDIAYPAAQKYYERALKSDPANADAALGLAQIYVLQGRFEDAANVLAKPAALNRKNVPLHLLNADILTALRRYGQANMQYSTGTAYDPQNAEAYYHWGTMLAVSGSPGAAETVLRQAIEINEAIQPRTPELKRRCAAYHLELARVLRDEGISIAAFMKELQAAIDRDPSYVDTYMEFAQTYLDAHEEGTAIKWLQDVIQHVDPNSAVAKARLARIYMNPQDPNHKNVDGAIALLAEAVADTQAKDVTLLANLASVLASVHRYDDALAQMNVAVPAARAARLPAWQIELLTSMRQDYFLATLPPITEGDGLFGIDGRVVHQVWDDPLPPPLQPDLMTVARRPMNMSQPPGPSNALDPALYTGAALHKPQTGEFEGMPILDVIK
jgi:tetratricopeptide (TPR) repeat protein